YQYVKVDLSDYIIAYTGHTLSNYGFREGHVTGLLVVLLAKLYSPEILAPTSRLKKDGETSDDYG
nr:hypothetical protein [Tanacetum cinerariifolium]